MHNSGATCQTYNNLQQFEWQICNTELFFKSIFKSANTPLLSIVHSANIPLCQYINCLISLSNQLHHQKQKAYDNSSAATVVIKLTIFRMYLKHLISFQTNITADKISIIQFVQSIHAQSLFNQGRSQQSMLVSIIKHLKLEHDIAFQNCKWQMSKTIVMRQNSLPLFRALLLAPCPWLPAGASHACGSMQTT